MTPGGRGFSARARWVTLVVIAVVVLGASGAYAVMAFQRYQDRSGGHSAASITTQLHTQDRIVFRNTASGEGYGRVASVALGDPGGAREISGAACDRVDAAAGVISCLRTLRGIPTTFETQILDAAGNSTQQWSLAGIPSRTRVSKGGLVATTAFVTGHSYAADSFSTETTIRGTDGTNYGNLEYYTMMIDGRELTAIDRNVWGVSFVSEDEFYATVASGGKTWLVNGSLSQRKLVSVGENAECPSVSPDGTRVAYKKRSTRMGLVHWDIAVLDLLTKKEITIPLENGFDDQLEWLDKDTLLFGMSRTDAAGDSDVYRIQAEEAAQPDLLIEHAWSPSVVRGAN